MKKRNLKLALMTVMFASIIGATSSIIVSNQISEKQKKDTKISFSREEPMFPGVKGQNKSIDGAELGNILVYTPSDSEYIQSNGELSLNWNKITSHINLGASNQYINIILPLNITSININSSMPYRDKIYSADFSQATNLTHIEQFSNLPNLRWIDLPESVSTLGVGAFKNNPELFKMYNLSTTNISKIPTDTFRATALRYVYLSDNVTSIGGNAFADIPGFNIESANFPAKFNNATKFAEMGIKKPSGDPFSNTEFDLQTIQWKDVFKETKINELIKNPYYSPIELIKLFNKKSLIERISYVTEAFPVPPDYATGLIRESTVRDVRAKFDANTNKVYLEVIPNSLYAFAHKIRYLTPKLITTITKFTTSIALDQEFASYRLPWEILDTQMPSFVHKIQNEIREWNNKPSKDFTFSQGQVLKELKLNAVSAPETAILDFMEVGGLSENAYVFDIILKNATGADQSTKADIPLTFSVKVKPDPNKPKPPVDGDGQNPDNNGNGTVPGPDGNASGEKTEFSVKEAATIGIIVGGVVILALIIGILIFAFKKKRF